MNRQGSDINEFNYSTLDSEARIIVQQRASEIKSLMRQTVQNIVEIGEKLTQAKAELGHGNFTKWLKYEFEWQERSARNFMRVAEVFKTAKFADLDFAPSALYLLAAPSVPEQVRHRVLTLANRGETITYTKAKSIICEYKKNSKNELIEVFNSETKENTDNKKVESIESLDIESNSRLSVSVLPKSIDKIQVEINCADINLSMTASKNNAIAFLAQIQSAPNLAEKILQQIKLQTAEQLTKCN